MVLGERFYKMSNAIFTYGLTPIELAVYSYLVCCAGRPVGVDHVGQASAPSLSIAVARRTPQERQWTLSWPATSSARWRHTKTGGQARAVKQTIPTTFSTCRRYAVRLHRKRSTPTHRRPRREAAVAPVCAFRTQGGAWTRQTPQGPVWGRFGRGRRPQGNEKKNSRINT